eukprot:TRINITY_DN5930_c0_g1_i1.p1 TRINITY_DN5930_c0_g1~~TRINITY_DN5930_c0_g1_i1.p1  ORF type:complete len:240 (-),score=41.70 TRINITY_DN5930_c0_g1_i1:399-1118(-)
MATISPFTCCTCNSLSLPSTYHPQERPSNSTISRTHHKLLCKTANAARRKVLQLSQQKARNNGSIKQCGSEVASLLGRCSIALLMSATFCLADPAQAFKGGGPYGAEVTRGADLSGRDFSGKNLAKQDFKTSILRQAKFKGAYLVGASFFDADLTGADLSDADLRAADLSLANITKADLSNANLEGALVTGNTSFKGSTITGADFTDVSLRDDQRRYLCSIADGVNGVTGNATKETLLC